MTYGVNRLHIKKSSRSDDSKVIILDYKFVENNQVTYSESMCMYRYCV